jgi:hypothetical protein
VEQWNLHSKNCCRKLLPLMVGCFLGLMMFPSPALAFIPHWDPREAFFIRQFAYLFWAFAMVFFIFALKQENLQQHRGFRWLVWSAIFFALWNFDCFIGQFVALSMDSQGGAGLTGTAQDLPVATMRLWFHYFTKLDHLFLVPAFLFFYLGIRAFNRDLEVRPR